MLRYGSLTANNLQTIYNKQKKKNLANISLQFYLNPFLRTHLCSNELVQKRKPGFSLSMQNLSISTEIKSGQA